MTNLFLTLTFAAFFAAFFAVLIAIGGIWDTAE